MLPLDITAELGKFGGYIVYFLIGTGFGVSLELAGFGDSRRLAAQFYFKDMTVLKTMFTGIIVACLLIFLASGIGILDFSQLAVNETYLWPGIVGGLVMGVGFIIGGYCPGTSIIATASLKMDGLFFVLGALIGVGVFGETLPSYEDFFNSSFSGKVLVSDWLGWSVGATVFAVILLALAMFYGAEKSEEFFKNKETGAAWTWKITNKSYLYGSGVFILIALIIWIIGQPDPQRKWELMENKYASQLMTKEVFISPLEYVKSSHEASIKLVTLDFRAADEFKNFHLKGSETSDFDQIIDAEYVSKLAQLPAQAAVVLIADNDSVAVKAWQLLKVQGINNLYILENGLNDWNKLFAGKTVHGHPINLTAPPTEILEQFPADAYVPKIKVGSKKKAGGLCG